MGNFHSGVSAPVLRTKENSAAKQDELGTNYHRFCVDNAATDSPGLQQNKAASKGIPPINPFVYDVANPEHTVELFQKLAAAIAAQNSIERDTSPNTVDGEQDWENRPGRRTGQVGIPAGHVYLLQLAAHDLILSSPSKPTLDKRDPVPVNLRRVGLELETIFGGGPATCPYAYEPVEEGGLETTRVRLKVGSHVRKKRRELSKQRHELARCSERVDQTGQISFRDVLIPDPRNDDNLLLSQLTALIHRIYNSILDELNNHRSIWKNYADDNSFNSDDELRSAVAREILSHAYRSIIRYELLPSILDLDVLEVYETLYLKHGAKFFFDQPAVAESQPIEFAHAASRLGHFMLRPNYMVSKLGLPSIRRLRLKQIIRTSSRRASRKVPHAKKYEIAWERFFPRTNTDESDVNWAARFLLSHRRDVRIANLFVVPQVAPKGSLFLRDLLRGADAGLPTPDSICRYMRAETSRRIDYLGSSSSLDLDPQLFERLRKSIPGVRKVQNIIKRGLAPLRDQSKGAHLEQADIDELTENCPLFLFLILEAQELGEQTRLGPLASVIFAEVFYRGLSRHQDDVGIEAAEREEKISSVAHAFFASVGAQGVPKKMSDLIDTTVHQ